MATQTLVTNGNLTAVRYSQSVTTLLPADLATVNYGILDDVGNLHAPAAISGLGGFNREGILVVPGRGWLKVLPGDVVAVDITRGAGWPILVSANAIATGLWTLT